MGQAPLSPVTHLPLEHTGLQANLVLRKLMTGVLAAGLLE